MSVKKQLLTKEQAISVHGALISLGNCGIAVDLEFGSVRLKQTGGGHIGIIDNDDPSVTEYHESPSALSIAYGLKWPEAITHNGKPMELEQKLEFLFGDEHPQFTRTEHDREVNCGDTRLWTYWEWVIHQIEGNEGSLNDEATKQRLEHHGISVYESSDVPGNWGFTGCDADIYPTQDAAIMSAIESLGEATECDDSRSQTVNMVPQTSLSATQSALSNTMQTTEILRKALEVIATGNAQTPRLQAQKALEEAGFRFWAQYEDDEVVGLDNNGCVLQWDGDKGMSYNSGGLWCKLWTKAR